jgi:hypothetical protein
MPTHPRPARHRTARLAGALVLTVALASATAACTSSESDSSGAPKGKAKVDEPATVNATTTTVKSSPPTVTTTAPPASTGRGSPQDAAQALYDAWKAGDRNAALAVAEPGAVDGIWKTAPGDYSLYNKCDTAEFGKDTGLGSSTSGCLFRGNSGTIQFSMEQRGDQWVVVEAYFAEP